jgi:two-component system, sensor histidine kinase LadS
LQKQNFNLTTIDYEENPDWKTSDFWIKIKVRNNSKTERWLIEILDFHIQHISFYDVFNDSLFNAGYLEKFDKRSYKHKNFIYDLKISIGEERTYLVKMSSIQGFGTIMKIYSHPVFVSYATVEYILLGFFYGFLILNAMYSLFMYMSTQVKAHIYYFFYVLAIGMRSLHNDGLGFQFLWNESPDFNSVLGFTSPLLLLVTFVLYSTAFLE